MAVGGCRGCRDRDGLEARVIPAMGDRIVGGNNPEVANGRPAAGQILDIDLGVAADGEAEGVAGPRTVIDDDLGLETCGHNVCSLRLTAARSLAGAGVNIGDVWNLVMWHWVAVVWQLPVSRENE